MLTKSGVQQPSYRNIGTTIVGLVFKDGVILGDTRAIGSSIVCDKNCEKIHYMAPNGAETAADTDSVADMVSSQLQLYRSRVVTALTLLKKHLLNYQRHVSAALVFGSVDVTGPHLHRNTQKQKIGIRFILMLKERRPLEDESVRKCLARTDQQFF